MEIKSNYIHLGLLAIMGLLSIATQGQDIAPIEDAFVQNGIYANTNYGSDSQLKVRNTSVSNLSRVSYLKFDLSTYNNITGANLKLYVDNLQNDVGDPPVDVSIYHVLDVDDNWSESAITWNTKPSNLGDLLTAPTVSTGNEGNIMTVDVTSAVQNELSSGNGIFTLAIQGVSSPDYFVFFGSNDSGAAIENPVLTLTEATAPQPPVLNTVVAGDSEVDLTWSNVVGATGYRIGYSTTSGSGYSYIDVGNTNNQIIGGLINGTTYYFVVLAYNANMDGTNSNELVATPQAAVSETNLSPLEDAFVQDGGYIPSDANTNYGTDPLLKVRKTTTSGQPSRVVYLKFDISSFSQVTNAELNLYVDNLQNDVGDPPVDVSVYHLSDADDVWSENIITWNNQPTSLGTLLSSPTVNTGPEGSVMTINVTSAALAELTTGNGTLSLAIEGIATPDYFVFFGSQNNPSSNKRPLLKVTSGIEVIANPPTLSLPLAGDSQVDLVWTTVDGATGYKVGQSISSGTNFTYTDVGNVTNYTVTNLSNNTQYYFNVLAYNSNGDGPISNERSAIPTPPSPSDGTLDFSLEVDTYVDSNMPNTNFGSSEVLRADGSGSVRISYLQYDLTGFSNVSSADLLLYVDNLQNDVNDVPIDITIYHMADEYDDWDEESISWNTRPSSGSPFTTLTTANENGTTAIDLTALAQTELMSGNGILSIAIEGDTSPGYFANFGSSDNSEPSKHPIFSVNGQPSLLTVLPANNQMGLNWKNIAGATGYRIYYGTSSGNYSDSIDVGNVNNHTISGLLNGTLYYFAIRAYDSSNKEGNYSNELSGTPNLLPPSAPTSVLAVAGSEQVMVSWNASPGATDYEVFYSTDMGGIPTAYTSSGSLGDVTNYTVIGLNNGTTYYFVVKAINSEGSSPNSVEVSALPNSTFVNGLSVMDDASVNYLEQDKNYGADPYLEIEDARNEIFSYLKFDASQFSAVTSATLQLYVDELQANNSIERRTIDIYGVTDDLWEESTITWINRPALGSLLVENIDLVAGGNTIDIDVSSYVQSEIGSGDKIIGLALVTDTKDGRYRKIASSEASVPTERPILEVIGNIEVPAAPIINNVVSNTGQAHVSWSGVSNATGYVIDYGTTANGPYPDSFGPVTNLSATIDNLTNNQTYYFVVRAVNQAGGSNNSTESSVLVNANTPLAPVLTSITPIGGELNVVWEPIPFSNDYEIGYSETSGGPYTFIKELGNITTYPLLNGLTNGTTYYIVVRGSNDSGEGPVSNELSAIPQIERPSILFVESGDGEVTLHWSLSQGATGYKVNYGTSPGQYTTTVDMGNVSSFSLTGLTNGTTYYLTISSYNDNGGLELGTNEIIARPTRTIPDPPNFDVATFMGNGKVYLRWDPSFYADGYTIHYGTSSGTYTESVTVGKKESSFIENIESGVKYFAVEAFNSNGVSGTSNELSAVVNTSIVIPVGADASVREGNAMVNYGNKHDLEVWQKGVDGSDGRNQKAYLKFDLSSIPGLTSAVLRMYAFRHYNESAITSGMEVELYEVSDDSWGENTITYNNGPSVGNLITTGMTGGDESFMEVDITGYAKSNLSINGGNDLLTLFIDGPSNNNDKVRFFSKEAEELIPVLVIEPESIAPAPVVLNGSSRLNRIKLEWSESLLAGNGYTVYWDDDASGAPYSNFTTVPFGTLSYTIDGLTNGVPYYVAITADNSYGSSSYSNELSISPNPSVPSAPSNLSVSVNGESSLNLSWSKEDTASGYTISYGSSPGSYTNTISVGDVSSYTLSGLNTRERIYITVQGSNAEGLGSYAPEVNGTPYSASTFYVDAFGGNDSNNGLGEGTAWQSLAKVNSMELFPGDYVYFKDDGVWTGQLKPRGNGAEGAPIIMAKYGTGGVNARPTIISSNNSGAIRIENMSFIELNDFEITESSNGSRLEGGGVIIYNDKAGIYKHIYLNNLYIHGEDLRSGITFTNSISDDSASPNHIPIRNDDVRIENCHIKDVGMMGIYVETGAFYLGAKYEHMRGVVIRNNVVDNVIENTTGEFPVASGIILVSLSDLIVEYNEVTGHNNTGIWVFNCTGVRIRNNYVHDGYTATGLDGQGIHFDYWNEDVIAEYNMLARNGGGALSILGQNLNTHFRYNISVNDGWQTPKNYIHFSGYNGRFQKNFGSTNCTMQNNTLYVDDGIMGRKISIDEPYFGDSRFVNNLIYFANGSNLSGQGVDATVDGITFGNNLLFGPISNIHTGSGTIVGQNPLLANPGSDSPEDYQLLPGSPAIGSGVLTPITGNRDYFGNPVSSSSSPAIGAHEYQATNIVPLRFTIEEDSNSRNESEFLLYPNPSRQGDLVSLALLGVPNDQLVRASIFSIDGRLLDSKEYNVMTGDNVLEINVSGFSAGLYIVKIEGATLSFSKRLYVYR